MKKSELQQLISECIAEVLAEDKKTLAINEIKRIIAENELDEAELDEVFGIFKSKPATDDELNKWLKGNPAISKKLAEMEPEKANSWKEFVKKEFASNIKNDEAILNVTYENGKWVKTSGRSGGRFTGFTQ